jgi:hypothetical protein
MTLHAKDLSTCVDAQNKLARRLQWEYSCLVEAENRINSWIPYALQQREDCSIEEPE